ncbi:MAG: sugar phosphate nucleotidyltransferase [Candidatus Parvarchaeota archaeon]
MLKEGVNSFVKLFNNGGYDCVVGVAQVKDPSRYGIVEMSDDRPNRFVEKPKEPKSNLALIGVYVFNSSIFDTVKKIKPSWRNELEITDAIQLLLEENKRIAVQRVNGWWKDTGKPEDLLEANQLVLADIKSSIEGEISEDAELAGSIVIGKGSKVLERSRLRGPIIIGSNCTIGPDVFIGPYTSIGDDCILRNTEIENSIVMKGTRIESGKRVIDSLIGSYSTILNSDSSMPRGHKLIIGERSVLQI